MFSGLSTTIKLGALCFLLALLGVATTYGAWQFRSSMARTEVADAIKAKDAEILAERAATKKWRDSAANLRAEVDAKKTQAKVVTATVTQAVKAERAANPSFYEQEVPQGGAVQWEAARNLMR
jgi:hypothetical protein